MLHGGQLGGNRMSIVGWVVLAVVVLLLLYVMGVYNRLVRLRALVREGFSGITVQLRRRADLMTSLLGRLMVVAEAYPDLKASQNFQGLQDELSAIEGELQSARRYYNATVRDLNTNVQSFPPVLIARPFGFNEEPFYQEDDPA